MTEPKYKEGDLVIFDWAGGDQNNKENSIAKGIIREVNVMEMKSSFRRTGRRIYYDIEFCDDMSDTTVMEEYVWLSVDIDEIIDELIVL